MTFLKISIPVYKKHKWESLSQDGKIEVSSEVDHLEDGYEELKIQIDHLLSKLDAQNRLAENVANLENEIQDKSCTLRTLLRDIDNATAHYQNLKLFLENLGVDPTAPRLTFDKRLLLQNASVSRVEILSNSEF
ncbi:hypothetical protein [Microcoleus sp. herbarium14]|uniref:hypothetical protein n=1 Tax=Microcoleus sp. herbarium14 TaxID=3055439 RepID=UPI002FD66F97